MEAIPALGCWSGAACLQARRPPPHQRTPCRLPLDAADAAGRARQRCGLSDLPPQPPRLHPEPLHYQISKLDATRRRLRLEGCVSACLSVISRRVCRQPSSCGCGCAPVCSRTQRWQRLDESHLLHVHLPSAHAPCLLPAVLYLHPICAAGSELKEHILRQAGFWFMDSEQGECWGKPGLATHVYVWRALAGYAACGFGGLPCAAWLRWRPATRVCLSDIEWGACAPRGVCAGCAAQKGSASGVPACRPLHWRLPATEAAHYSCHSFELGLTHGGEPAAVAALRAGATGQEAEQLLEFAHDSAC